MGLGCGSSLIKIVLFIFNLICVLGGIAFIVLGALFLVKTGDVQSAISDVKDGNVTTIPIALIIVGSVITIIAFFGCCGAVRESQCMTMTYAFFMFVLIVVQIAIAVLILLYKEDVKREIITQVRRAFDGNYSQNKEAIDKIQWGLECCGAEESSFWASLPQSCCPKTYNGNCNELNKYRHGCVSVLREHIKNYSNYAIYTVFGIAAVELLGLIFACCLSTSIRNERRRYD